MSNNFENTELIEELLQISCNYCEENHQCYRCTIKKEIKEVLDKYNNN